MRNITFRVTGEGHSKRNIEDQQLGEFSIQRDSVVGVGKGILHIVPTVVGVGMGDRFI